MATTADILGLHGRPAIPTRWASHYKLLCGERDRLLERDCSAPESSPAKLDDQADAASEETLQGMSWTSAAATNDTLREVSEALRRIECGTYGLCEITGEPIEVERLSAIPWARYSYAGQDEWEKGGAGRKVGFTALESQEDLAEEKEEEPELKV